jgi:hypothetical protein
LILDRAEKGTVRADRLAGGGIKAELPGRRNNRVGAKAHVSRASFLHPKVAVNKLMSYAATRRKRKVTLQRVMILCVVPGRRQCGDQASMRAGYVIRIARYRSAGRVWPAIVRSIRSARSALSRASALSSSPLAMRLKPTTSAARIADIFGVSVITPVPRRPG